MSFEFHFNLRGFSCKHQKVKAVMDTGLCKLIVKALFSNQKEFSRAFYYFNLVSNGSGSNLA